MHQSNWTRMLEGMARVQSLSLCHLQEQVSPDTSQAQCRPLSKKQTAIACCYLPESDVLSPSPGSMLRRSSRRIPDRQHEKLVPLPPAKDADVLDRMTPPSMFALLFLDTQC